MTAGNNSGLYEKFKPGDNEFMLIFPDNLWQAEAVTNRTFPKRTSYPSFCMTRAYLLSLFSPSMKLSQEPLQLIFPLENIKQFPPIFLFLYIIPGNLRGSYRTLINCLAKSWRFSLQLISP